MQDRDNNSSKGEYDLNGYAPYQFVDKHHGKWTPFNQTTVGNVGTLNLVRKLQREKGLTICPHSATCQGTGLTYLKLGASVDGLFRDRGYTLNTQNVRTLATTIDFQINYGAQQDARRAMEKMDFTFVQEDVLPKKMDLESILFRIKYAVGNVFILTCEDKTNPDQEFAHCFVIVNDNHEWKFFEAHRGEVSFDSFQAFHNWLMEEATKGVLKDLTSYTPVEVRRDDEGTAFLRHYTHYSLGAYQKDFSMNPSSPSDETKASTYGLFSDPKKGFIEEKKTKNTFSVVQSKSAYVYDYNSKQSEATFEKFVDLVDKKLVGKNKNEFIYEMQAEVAVIEVQQDDHRYTQWGYSDYKNYKASAESAFVNKSIFK